MERELTRRDAIRVGAVGAGMTLAGCSDVVGLSGPNVSNMPEKRSDDNHTDFIFTHDGENQLVVQLNYELQREAGVYQTPLDAQIFHNHDELHIKDLELKFKPVGTPRADIFWKAPRFDWKEAIYEETGDGWTRLSVSDLGRIGESSFVLDFHIRYPRNEEPNNPAKMFFNAEFDLGKDGLTGGSTTARINDEFAMPLQ